jgi:hypothetical protein
MFLAYIPKMKIGLSTHQTISLRVCVRFSVCVRVCVFVVPN